MLHSPTAAAASLVGSQWRHQKNMPVSVRRKTGKGKVGEVKAGVGEDTFRAEAEENMVERDRAAKRTGDRGEGLFPPQGSVWPSKACQTHIVEKSHYLLTFDTLQYSLL